MKYDLDSLGRDETVIMIKRLHSEDIDMVMNIISHKDIWSWITDDMSPPEPPRMSLVNVLDNSNEYVLGLGKNGAPCVGLAAFHPINGITFDFHIMVLPEYRGDFIRLDIVDSISWMFNSTPCRKIEASVPEFNERMRKAIIKWGFAQEGISRGSFMKNNTIYNRHVFGKEG